MENDSVRTSGDATLVDMWIEGKLRAISLSRGAIETHLRLPADRAAALTEDDRREFVRTNLGLVVAAAKERLRTTDPAADVIEIEAGQLGGRGGAQPAREGERRGGDRRKGDRRKVNVGPPPTGERRR